MLKLWENPMLSVDVRLEIASGEIDRLKGMAADAYEAWDNDRDAKVGKLLRAMADDEFRAMYRPDTVPNEPSSPAR